MSDVKIVIGILCKHLHLSLNINIKPEHFRLSKFDQTEENCVSQLWQVLHKILNIIVLCGPIVKDNVVTSVKLQLFLMKYHCIEFYCLPSDMTYGSREVLLALTWLLVKENVLEILLLKKLMDAPLRTEYLDNKDNQEVLDARRQPVPKTLADELNYILHMGKKINANCNVISEAANTRAKLMSKIHQGSIGTCGLPHLSVAETSLIRHPQHVPQHLVEVEVSVQLIDTHKQWLSKSHIFWEWMESVLAEKKKESSHRLNVHQKHNLVELLNTLRLHLKTSIEVPVKSEAKEVNSATHAQNGGMARYLMTTNETELDKWLPESIELVKNLIVETNKREEDLRFALWQLAQKLDGIDHLKSKILQEPKSD